MSCRSEICKFEFCQLRAERQRDIEIRKFSREESVIVFSSASKVKKIHVLTGEINIPGWFHRPSSNKEGGTKQTERDRHLIRNRWQSKRWCDDPEVPGQDQLRSLPAMIQWKLPAERRNNPSGYCCQPHWSAREGFSYVSLRVPSFLWFGRFFDFLDCLYNTTW